ncbi:MAG: protein kinase [Acidimicrobiia bacterium]|nr:protein kinase [Acidimicrobiia bacterium]
METEGHNTPLIRVFGGMGLDTGDGPVSIGGARQRRLLALLAIRANTVVDIDWLAEYLWTDADRPDTTAPPLRTYVSRLRASFPEEIRAWIETEASGYRLAAPEETVEHTRFALLRSRARAARDHDDPETAQRLLDEALGLWRGDPFRELEDLDWVRAEVERLNLDRLEALEERWEAALALGRHTQITGELAAFTSEHGLRERAARQYALALHRSGRTAEALRVIEDHRRVIADVSGLEPSQAIIDLEDALLTGDPSLDIADEGRPLRGYRLIEQIGTGAFSVVWRGIQPSVNREVAIKQIRSELASQPEFIRRFEAEAHLVAQIEHPHIVPLIDYWRDPDSAYLVMRWLRGGTLERRLDGGPLSLEQTLAMARQIGDALSTAHARNVVHRDVKAGNILFDEQGNAFLSDFGIALEVAESSGPEAALSPGSPAYASPEQIRRERLSPASDVFSLGVVVYECLAGALPFPDSSSAEELIHRQLNLDYPPLIEVRSDVPPTVSAAVARATAKEPGQRFESVEAFLAALETANMAAEIGRVTATRADVPNPYIGLRSFDDGDVDRFFGRERLVSELVERLSGNTIGSRCLVVVGPSGSGKSSVVRAGLTPALRAGAVAGSDDWFVTTMVPGADPFESLEAALLRIAMNPPDSLLGQLHSGERGLLRGLRRCVASDDDRVLLVIDQFEEVFAGPGAESADAFLDALAVAVEDPTSPLRLVVTLRADFYDRPLEHPTFAPILKETAVDVTPLAPDELERAIVEPARRVGVEFESGLVPRIAAETVSQPSPLPMLQYMLGELFDRRAGNRMTVTDYEELGGLSGALAARAEAVFESGTASQKAAARRALGRMTDPSAADLRRRVKVSDLGDDADVGWVLDRFGKARLLSFDRDPATREPTVEVAHEALLREWPRLVGWLAEDRELLLSLDATATAATAWVDAGRQPADLYRGARLERANELLATGAERLRPLDFEFIEASNAAAVEARRLEQSRVTRLRRLVSGVAAALVIAVIAGGIAVVQQNRANDEAQRAEIAAEDARTQASIAEAQAEVAEQQTQVALDAVAESELQTLVARSAALTREQPTVALLLALEAARRQPGPAADQAVLNALGSTTENLVATYPPLVDPEDECQRPVFVSDDGLQFSVVNGQAVSRNLLTGEITEHGTPPVPCSTWFGSPDTSRWFGTALPPDRIWFGDFGESWDVALEPEFPMFALLLDVTPLNRALFQDDQGVIRLLDATTGGQVGPAIEGHDDWWNAAMTDDGRYIAVPLAFLESSGAQAVRGAGRIVVLDGETGEQVFSIDTEAIPRPVVFDDSAGELIVGMSDGSIITIDLETEEIVSTVESGAASNINSIGVRPDGRVIVLTDGNAELIDRRLGPLGVSIPMRDFLGYGPLPDGRIAVMNSRQSMEIYDFDPSNALIERTWNAEDAFTEFAFNDGKAGGVDFSTSEVRVVDLMTGGRSSVPLRKADGSRFQPIKAYPETVGVSAIDAEGLFGRFENGIMVESVQLRGSARGGTRYGDMWSIITEDSDGDVFVEVIDLKPDAVRLVQSIPADETIEVVHPTLDGGVHFAPVTGPLSTYDATGMLVSEIEVGHEMYNIVNLSEKGVLAVAAEGRRLLLIDTTTGEIELVPTLDGVANLGFGRDGELLAVTGFDGTVRLWGVERRDWAGLIWDGEGAVRGSPSWYDPETESMWLFATGKLLQAPLNPERWIEKACEVVGRGFTQDEWDRYVPGDEPLTSACD